MRVRLKSWTKEGLKKREEQSIGLEEDYIQNREDQLGLFHSYHYFSQPSTSHFPKLCILFVAENGPASSSKTERFAF